MWATSGGIRHSRLKGTAKFWSPWFSSRGIEKDWDRERGESSWGKHENTREKGDEERRGGRTWNNKNANVLKSGRNDKGIKTKYKQQSLWNKVVFFKWKLSTTRVLFFHYLHLRLRLIGHSMQTCKQREGVRDNTGHRFINSQTQENMTWVLNNTENTIMLWKRLDRLLLGQAPGLYEENMQ